MPVRSASTASSGATRALAGGQRRSSRHCPSRLVNASSMESSASPKSGSERSASASSSRSVRANSSNPVSKPARSSPEKPKSEPKSRIITCRDNLIFQPLKRPMLGHPDRTRGAAHSGGGLLGGQPDDNPQDQDLALLGRQDLEQFVHPGDRIRLDGQLFRARVDRPAFGNRFGGICEIAPRGPMGVGDLVGRDAVQECQERTSPVPISRQRRYGGQANLLSHVICRQPAPLDRSD